MPFGRNCEFKNFKACVRAMTGKVDDPSGFCGALMRDTEEECMRKAAADIVEGSWDADAEEKKVRRWASSDGSGKPDTVSWSKYGRAFAVIEGKGDKFGDFGFQHHVVRDGKLKLHRRGAQAAWGAAMGARAGKPNTTAQAHLKPHRQTLFDNPAKKSLSAVVPAFIALTKPAEGGPVRLIVRDDLEQPRFWCLEKFGAALRQLMKIVGGEDQVELEFNPDGDEDAEPLCDLVITDDGMELVRAATVRLTLLGVGAVGSQTHAPAGLLVEVEGTRVMLDGGPGLGGDAVPKGRLDAWLVTDENGALMPAIQPLAEERDVKAWVGSYHKGNVTISPQRIRLTGRSTWGYSIRVGDKLIVWAPVIGEYPRWAWGAELMFADGVTNYPSVAATAEEAEVKRLVFARIDEQSGVADPELDFGEWGDDKDTYTPTFSPRPKDGDGKATEAVSDESSAMMCMEVTEKAADQQYTFGVVYKATERKQDPALDAHREYIMADDLQKAAWEYVKTGDRRVYFQHGVQGIIPLGEYVDFVVWPYEVEVELTLPGQKAVKTMIPAGSVWMGVVWNSMGWDLVKSGQIRGFSLGGFCEKAEQGVPTGDDVI